MTRTVKEILDRIKAVEKNDWLGTIRGDLVSYLPYSDAKPFLKPEVTEAGWKVRTMTPLENANNYLTFAWGKANDCRSLSAGRSIEHFQAWMWLAGRDDIVEILSDGDRYCYYGKPLLVMVSALVGFDWAAADDGRWANDEDSLGLNAEARDDMARDYAALAIGAIA